MIGLCVLASPFLGVKWGSVDHRILPPDSEAYVAAEKLATDFGPETATATLLLDGTEQADVAAYTREVAAVDGVVSVQPAAAEGGVTLLRAAWEGRARARRPRTWCASCARSSPPAARPWSAG